MSEMSKIKKTNLICITGTMHSGKTLAINYLNEKKFNTFIMDDYIKEIYKFGNIGYKKIFKYFGANFVNTQEVDRNKLRDFILLSSQNKKKLDNIMVPIIEKKIKSFSNKELIFIELGIYIYFPFIFKTYFDKIITIRRDNNLKIKDVFFSLNKTIKFSTINVEKSKKVLFSNNIYSDFIVENNGDIPSFYKKIQNILLNLNL